MLDQHFLRAEYESIAEKLKPRGYELDIAYYENLESRRRSVQSETESARNQKNELSKQIGKLKSRGEDTSSLMTDVEKIGMNLEGLEQEFSDVQSEFQAFMSGIPNIAHESVPIGGSEEDNLEIRRVGEPRQFNLNPRITLL